MQSQSQILRNRKTTKESTSTWIYVALLATLLMTRTENVARAAGVLVSGASWGLYEIDVANGRERNWDIRMFSLNPTPVRRSTTFYVNMFPHSRILEIDLLIVLC